MPKLNLKDRLEDGQLDLSMSELEEVPVRDIAAIKKASNLDLSNNKLTSLGKNFTILTHIVKLDLSKNCLTELPEDFGTMVQLKHLDLYSNQIERLPLSFGHLKNLRWLDLKNNPLVPALMEKAGQCLDSQQCQQCARSMVQFLQKLEAQVEEERQRRLLQQQNKENAQVAQAQKKEQKKKKKAKANDKPQAKEENGPKHSAVEDITPHNMNSDTVKVKKQHVLENSRKAAPKKSTVVSCFGWLLRTMFYLILMLALASFALHFFNKEAMKEVQTKLGGAWNVTVASLPPNVVEFGRSAVEYVRPSASLAWSKLCIVYSEVSLKTQDVYAQVKRNESVQKFLVKLKTFWDFALVRVSELYRYISLQVSVYVDAVQKMLK